MNETLISGLLGAVMGGTSSIEKSLAEEEAARRKEEEEKRREERALTIAERKMEMEAAKKQRLEEARRGEIASYLPAATGATPSQSPMEPEGGGVTEFQVPTEQRLVRGIEAAISKGDTEAAKLLSDQYAKITGEKRAQSKEERDIAKFLQEPTEKIPERIKTVEALTDRFYKQSGGQYDEQGNPTDAKALASASKKAEDYVFLTMRERMGIIPGAAGGEKPPRAITPKEETAARNSLQRDLARLSEVTDAKGKVTRNPLMWESLNKITSRIIKEDHTKLLDPGLADEARAEVQAAIERARTDIRADLEKKTDAKGKPLPGDQIRKNEAILRNQYSFDRYSKENLPKYVNRYLGGGATEEPKRGGMPWERSWGSME